MVDVEALLVKQVVGAECASPALSFCYSLEFLAGDVVRLTVSGSAYRPVGLQCGVVGRSPTSHLDVTSDFGCGETVQVRGTPLAASVTCSGLKDPPVAPNPPEVSWDD